MDHNSRLVMEILAIMAIVDSKIMTIEDSKKYNSNIILSNNNNNNNNTNNSLY